MKAWIRNGITFARTRFEQDWLARVISGRTKAKLRELIVFELALRRCGRQISNETAGRATGAWLQRFTQRRGYVYFVP
jgi:hypothetical protein